MREELEALVYELKQLRREGVTAIPIADATLERLREVVDREAVNAPAATRPSPTPAAPPSPAEAADVAEMLREVQQAGPAKKGAARKDEDGPAPIPPPPKVVLPEGSKTERWEWLRDRVLGDLVCQEHVKPGKKVVFGVGSVDAKIFFCGEAPGADEEVQGEPFVGPAGQLLTKIIGAMGLRRSDVYIGNIMNWRPEMPTAFGNRPPTAEEMAYCLPYLRAQVEAIEPAVIVALGKTAVDGLLGPDPKRKMSQVRGKWFEFAGIPLLPTFHPSYLLRNNSNRTKRMVWEDVMAVMERIEMPISEKQRGYFL